jgi:hypothetical protein
MVKSAESGTGYDPQFPLLVGADCIAFHGTTVEPVVSENSIVVRQTLDTFDSFEISDLEKAHELSERWCNNVTSAGHFERRWNSCASQPYWTADQLTLLTKWQEDGYQP